MNDIKNNKNLIIFDIDKYKVIIVLCLISIIPFLLPKFYIFLSSRILFLALVSMSFIFLSGYGGMMSLAQVSFYGIAGYTIGIGALHYNLPFELLIPLALLFSILLGIAFGFLAIRTYGNYFLMISLALAALFYRGVLQWASLTNGYNGLTGIPSPKIFGLTINTNTEFFYFILIPVIICYFVLRYLTKTPFGIILQGIRDSTKRMYSLGFNVNIYRYCAIVISAFFAGISGIMVAYFYGVMAPNSVKISVAIMILFVSLLGGITRFEGALVGSTVYVLLEDFASKYTNRYHMIIGIFFILIVMYLPNGITEFNWKKVGLKFKQGFSKQNML